MAHYTPMLYGKAYCS